ncbi:putative membrane protein, TIGR04086 family [Paenibacillaceae bacterium GAS479]|nr:putative membrane protein, TIGR04086 family [Paenibacillaceae bacterium GAS479]
MHSIKNVPKMHLSSPMLAGIVSASLWLSLGALLMSLLLYGGNLSENSLPAWSLGVHGSAALCGGFTSGKRSGTKGWYHGGALGLVYGLMVLLISFLAADAGMSVRTGIMFLIVALAGALGGMVGVNLRK